MRIKVQMDEGLKVVLIPETRFEQNRIASIVKPPQAKIIVDRGVAIAFHVDLNIPTENRRTRQPTAAEEAGVDKLPPKD